MALETSYGSQAAGSPTYGGGGTTTPAKGDYWPLEKLRKCFTDYLFSKRAELDEQIEARRYYHGTQWTQEQIAALKRRKQPIMTFNKVAEKINAYVGQIEQLRQDPKAYARTPQHADGADLATATLNYVLDEQEWEDKSPMVAQDGAIEGIAGMELQLVQGDQGDPEVGVEVVDVQAFFYDPRSRKPDFSDARYMGLGRWVDHDIATQMYPDASSDAFTNDAELHTNSDAELRWFRSEGVQKRVRIVEIWYQHNGKWCWASFSGNAVLEEGESPYKDEKGKTFCKFIMFSANVDQDGDRYGFVRNMKSAQDGINAKQSKLQHILASKRLFIREGGVGDVEKIRAEYAKPDGVIQTPGPPKESVLADDQSFDFAGWTKLLEFNMVDLDNSGPNPQLVGEEGGAKSGRAIALLQQAGMAKLGPYILAYKGWKIRLYRAIWNCIQQHWKAERWVRVTDDQDLAQYIQINGLGLDPQTGMPTIINAIGSLDVDIILDEGPDHINSMADVYETLSNILPSIAPVLDPGKAQLVVDTLIETSPLPSDIKKRFKDQSAQMAQQPPPPDPAVEQAKIKAELDMAAKAKDLEIEEIKATNEIQRKQQEHLLEMQAKREEMDMAWEMHRAEMQREQERCQMQHEAEMAKGEMQMHHEARKANMNLEHERAKSEITIKTQRDSGDIKKRQMLAIADPKAANELDNLDAFKELMSSFKDGLTEIVKAVEKDDKPEKQTIKIERGKDGRITGAVLQEA
jgi:hypothetical protein